MTHPSLTPEELFTAYYDCRKNKRNTHNAIMFEQNLERNLMNLYYDLINDRYTIGSSICFVVKHPQPREIWAASFRDRIVHHLIYNRYNNDIDNSFIYDSYACRPGKGNLKAAQRLDKFIRSASENYTRTTYFLKCDIANFFVSINKKILLNLFSKIIKDPWWYSLLEKIIVNDSKQNAIYKGKDNEYQLIPKRKSLLHSSANVGLPVGNLLSQVGGNVYLNELDHYVKHRLKIKYYIRYVDDMVLLSNDPKQLNRWFEQMSSFVFKNLDIRYHKNKTQINTVDKGVDFVGYVIKPHRKYVRRMTTKNMKSKVFDKSGTDKKPSINSYMGLISHANTYNFRKSIATRLGTENFNRNITKVTKNEIR